MRQKISARNESQKKQDTFKRSGEEIVSKDKLETQKKTETH